MQVSGSRTSRGVLCAILICAGGFVSLGAAPAQAGPNYAQIIADEAYFVSLSQVEPCTGTSVRGAIALNPVSQNPGSVYINPYRANYGARALVAAGSHYFPMVKDWLIWYLNHVNWPDYNGVYGTVYDYSANATACTEQPKVQPGDTHPYYDSTDAYAATWLSAMRAYAQANPADWAWFQSPNVVYWMDQEAHVSIYTLQPNGLTWAKPDYPSQYLMDNIEVLQGLNDYIWIAQNVLNDQGKVNYWTSYANTLSQGIQTYLWDDVNQGSNKLYAWASDQLNPSWLYCYPDGIAQLWPTWARYGPSSRRSATWRGYKSRFPSWASTTPAYPDISCPLHYTEAPTAYAAAQVGDKQSVDLWLMNSQINWINPGRPYPWTVADSGFRALAAQKAATLQ